jgi:hypothetical protein
MTGGATCGCLKRRIDQSDLSQNRIESDISEMLIT